MKTTLLCFLAALGMFWNSWSQTNTNEDYSKWFYLQGDKPVQVRYKIIKEEGNDTHFQVQFRLDHESDIFCRHSTCEGYLVGLKYYVRNQFKETRSFRFYNSYKGIYTYPEIIISTMKFSDGSYRTLKENGFFDNYDRPASILIACVDNILSDDPNAHRCRDEFKASEAIDLR